MHTDDKKNRMKQRMCLPIGSVTSEQDAGVSGLSDLSDNHSGGIGIIRNRIHSNKVQTTIGIQMILESAGTMIRPGHSYNRQLTS